MKSTRMLWDENYSLLQKIYVDLFKLMENNADFYICLVKPDPNNESLRAYLEFPPENVKISGILRVFYRKEDVDVYAHLIAAAEGLEISDIKRWEASYSEVLGYIRDLDMKHTNIFLPSIRATTSTISDEEIVDVDFFWTTEPENMV